MAADDKDSGEVVDRAPWPTRGYVKDAERGAALWKDGYLHTGDVDTSGSVYINPGYAERPIVLRRAPHSTPMDLDEFRPYKGDWYIRK